MPGRRCRAGAAPVSPSAFPPSLSAHQLLDQSWEAGLLIWNVSVGAAPPGPLPSAGRAGAWGRGRRRGARCERAEMGSAQPTLLKFVTGE